MRSTRASAPHSYNPIFATAFCYDSYLAKTCLVGMGFTVGSKMAEMSVKLWVMQSVFLEYLEGIDAF